MTYFLRATLGFEREVIDRTSAKLAETEDSALEHQRGTLRDPLASHQSRIYAVGTEYALCTAETQMMAAVLGVLNESLTESLMGFYKLRKAFGTLHEINEAEKTFLEARGLDLLASPSATIVSNDVDDEDLDFEDAQEQQPSPESLTTCQGNSDTTKHDSKGTGAATEANGPMRDTAAHSGDVEGAINPTPQAADEACDLRTITNDPIDLFIHSAKSLCFGIIQLLLSMVPPAFAKLLSILSFRGDRETGLRMLWSATKFKDNINGAMASLIILGYHNDVLAFCDILPNDAVPTSRLRALLKDMRTIYPKSKLWLMEEARMLSAERQLESAVDLIVNGPKSSLQQIEALSLFELSLRYMYLHRYQQCADSFLACIGLNNWSHALYYYIAGASYVELYRMNANSHPERAQGHADKAEECLRKVPLHAGKKTFMARPLPFDVFVRRKLAKWEARTRTQACRLVDAIGVSPAVEMTYFWSGFRRMHAEHLEHSLARLAWSEAQPSWPAEPADEHALLHFLRGACLRSSGRVGEARATLERDVLPHRLAQLKAGAFADTWPLPVAHYEMAVCHWQDAAGGADGDQTAAALQRCSEELAVIERWESYDLEARIGLKITTARETLRKVGVTGP